MAFPILIVHRGHSGNYINQMKKPTVVPRMVLMGPRELPIEFPLHHVCEIDQFPVIIWQRARARTTHRTSDVSHGILNFDRASGTFRELY